MLYVGYDNIISTKEKQAAAKQTFVFLVLISEHASAESRQECEARACEPEIESNEAAAKQTYKYKIQEDLRWRIVNIQE